MPRRLPSAQSLYLTDVGAVVQQGAPLITGTVEVCPFDRDTVITALRTDQAGQSTLPEFLAAIWHAGVVRYLVDLDAHTVTYYGSTGEHYVESYPQVQVPKDNNLCANDISARQLVGHRGGEFAPAPRITTSG